MKSPFSLLAALLAAGSLHAQGIRFEHGTLDQALALAKKQHKNVFIDCCMKGGKPCVELEDNVLPNKAVGDYYNSHYVSLRINMEQLPVDEQARTERVLADTIRHRYHVNGYPNLLFLTADGQLLHRHLGALSPENFIQLGKDALDPKQQYYAQAAAFRKGQYDTAHLGQLAADAFNYGDSQLAHDMVYAYLQGKTDQQLANRKDISLISFVLHDNDRVFKLAQICWDNIPAAQRLQPENMQVLIGLHAPADTMTKYLQAYLAQTPDSVLQKRANLPVLIQAAYAQGSKSDAYRYLWQHREAVDSALNQQLSLIKLFSRFMSQDMVVPFLQASHGTPDWNGLQQQLTTAYDEVYAKRVLLQTQLGYTAQQKDWPAAMQLLVAIDKQYGAYRSSYDISQEVAQPILAHSTDTAVLKYAVQRMQHVVDYESPTTGQLQVYAMLLYNAGQRDAAIHWENIALATDPDDKDIPTTLDQMKNGTLQTLQP